MYKNDIDVRTLKYEYFLIFLKENEARPDLVILYIIEHEKLRKIIF